MHLSKKKKKLDLASRKSFMGLTSLIWKKIDSPLLMLKEKDLLEIIKSFMFWVLFLFVHFLILDHLNQSIICGLADQFWVKKAKVYELLYCLFIIPHSISHFHYVSLSLQSNNLIIDPSPQISPLQLNYELMNKVFRCSNSNVDEKAVFL